jgi:cation transport regulator
MPYEKRENLPDAVKENLPEHAQDIYKEAFNSADKEYKDEERAYRVAWAAVKHQYHKDDKGKWVKN